MSSALGVDGLDREGPLPLYFQLREALLSEIRDRGLRPGDRLPTEAAMERRYGVSRSTIRQALNELAVEGMVRRIQGKGTFVAEPKIRHVPLLASFTELLRSQGHEPSHRILDSTVTGAPPEISGELHVEEGAPCRYLRRLLLADGRVVGVARTWLPLDLLGEHDARFEEGGPGEGSLYEFLQRPPIGLELHRAVETISPAGAEAPDAAVLGCEPDTPVLLVRRVTFDRADRAVEATHLAFSGERYEYRVELFRPPSPLPAGPGGDR
ncbi:MAG: GntR family transcriptional regulator [Actinobacteria bacterium]|nr:GntR family transcriptional regulator [Actinomycetota bacterium]